MKSYNSLYKFHLISFSASSFSILVPANVSRSGAFLMESFRNYVCGPYGGHIGGEENEG